MLLPAMVVTAGGLVVVAILRRHGWALRPSVAWALALAPAVGFGLVSLAFFFPAFAGFIPPSRWLLVALSAALGLAIAVPVFSRAAGADAGRGDVAEPIAAIPGDRRVFLAALLLVAMTLVLLLWTFPQVSKAQPYGGWDAWAIWNVRSLFLFRAGEDLPDIYSKLKHGHPDYPLLLPASLAAQYSLRGSEHLAIPQVTGLFFVLGSGAMLFLAVRRHANATAAAVAVAVLWSIPTFWRWAFVQYADIPLAYLLLAASAGLASQLDGDDSRRLPPMLAGLCFGLLTWIKNEGLVLALLLGMAFVAVHLSAGRWREPAVADLRRRTLRRLPWIAAGALPPLAALGLFKTFWSPANETAMFLGNAGAKLLSLERWRVVVVAFWGELNPWSGIATWGLLWPFVAVCVVVLWRSRTAAGLPVRFLGWAVMFAWVMWMVVYVCTPASQVWHLNSSLKRLLLQLTPLTLAWALAGAGRSREVSA